MSRPVRTVAVGERVNRLDLMVACRHPDQRVDAAVVVHEAPQLVEHASVARLARGRRVDDSARSCDVRPAFVADRHPVALCPGARSGCEGGSGRLPPRRSYASMMLSQCRSASAVSASAASGRPRLRIIGYGGDDVLDGGARQGLDHRQGVQQRLAVAELPPRCRAASSARSAPARSALAPWGSRAFPARERAAGCCRGTRGCRMCHTPAKSNRDRPRAAFGFAFSATSSTKRVRASCVPRWDPERRGGGVGAYGYGASDGRAFGAQLASSGGWDGENGHSTRSQDDAAN